MNIDEVISRINYLYKKGQESYLTEKEKNEQKILRQKYIDNVKKNFRMQMNMIGRKPNK